MQVLIRPTIHVQSWRERENKKVDRELTQAAPVILSFIIIPINKFVVVKEAPEGAWVCYTRVRSQVKLVYATCACVAELQKEALPSIFQSCTTNTPSSVAVLYNNKIKEPSQSGRPITHYTMLPLILQLSFFPETVNCPCDSPCPYIF